MFAVNFRYLLLPMLALSLVTVACKKGGGGGGGTGGPNPTPGPSSSPTPGQRYPGLASSCQALNTRTHGTCLTTGVALPEGTEFFFKGDLQEAISNVPRDPAIFDGDTVRPGKEAAYASQLINYLNNKGICAVYLGDINMFFRNQTDDYSEQIQFIHNRTRRPNIWGTVQCEPADAMPGTVRGYSCNIPALKNPTCVSSQNRFRSQVETIIREIIAEEQPKGNNSEIIDFRWPNSWELGYVLKDDGVKFIWRVVEKAHEKGFCVTHDNWKSFQLRDANYEELYSLVSHFEAPANKPDMVTACSQTGINQTCERIILKSEDTCISNP